MKNLIVLSGFSRDGDSYGKLIKSAPSGWKVIVPSYKKLSLHKGVDFFEQSLLSYIKSFSSSKMYLLGHSLGGALAIGFAAKYRNAINNLFLVDSKGVSTASLWDDLLKFLSHNKKRTLSEHVKTTIRVLKRPLFHIQSGMIAHKASLAKELRNIKAKTILFWGEKDGLTPLADGKKMQKLIPNSNLIVFKNLGHDWILDDPQKFWEKIH